MQPSWCRAASQARVHSSLPLPVAMVWHAPRHRLTHLSTFAVFSSLPHAGSSAAQMECSSSCSTTRPTELE